MRIAIVHSFYSSTVPSGENNVVLAQVAALKRRGHEVSLIAKYTDELAEDPAYKLRTAMTVMTQHGPSPLQELTEFKPDVVHVHNLFPNFSRAWLRSWTGPLVATLHNYRPVCAAGTLFRSGSSCTECIDHGSHRAIANRCYRGSAVATLPLAVQTSRGIAGDAVIRRADKLIVLAARARQMYESLGVADDRMVLLPNFVDQEAFTTDAKPGTHWVYVGRLAPEKGILTLINSWPQDQSLRIFGDGPLRTEIEHQTSRMPNIDYHGNAVASDVPSILAQSRGLVFPSEWPEGAPLIYVEALASGRPVVAMKGNSVADDVMANDTGLAYSGSDQLRSSLDAVTHRWNEYHIRARQHFEKEFSVDNWTTQIEELYKTVTEGSLRSD